MGVVGGALGVGVGGVLLSESVLERPADGNSGLEFLDPEDGEVRHDVDCARPLKLWTHYTLLRNVVRRLRRNSHQ